MVVQAQVQERCLSYKGRWDSMAWAETLRAGVACRTAAANSYLHNSLIHSLFSFFFCGVSLFGRVRNMRKAAHFSTSEGCSEWCWLQFGLFDGVKILMTDSLSPSTYVSRLICRLLRIESGFTWLFKSVRSCWTNVLLLCSEVKDGMSEGEGPCLVSVSPFQTFPD